jgi:hypothetical protein
MPEASCHAPCCKREGANNAGSYRIDFTFGMGVVTLIRSVSSSPDLSAPV